jgi:Zn-dependent protease
MEQFLAFPLEQLPFVFLVLMIAFTVHEFAHAYSAYKFGDPTAYRLGRVSLNPRVHLDVLGTILILIAGFGWAKPVPVNRSLFARPRLMGVIVSAVGPLSNLAIAFIGVFLWHAFDVFGVLEAMSLGVFRATQLFLELLIMLNIVLFLFNLIPLPPLDGYRIIEDIAPNNVRARLSQLEPYGIFVFLLMIFIPPIRDRTIVPLFAQTNDLYNGMSRIVLALLGQ